MYVIHQLLWHPVADKMPDDDTTVLLAFGPSGMSAHHSLGACYGSGMMTPTLTPSELRALTGYVQPSRQLAALRSRIGHRACDR
jgi:hypothetical protein